MAQTLIKAATTTDTARAVTGRRGTGPMVTAPRVGRLHMAPRGALTWTRHLVPECYDVGPQPSWSFTSVIALTGADASAPPTPSKAPVTKVVGTVTKHLKWQDRGNKPGGRSA